MNGGKKKQYRVYRIDIQYYNGRQSSTTRSYLGTTWAVSKDKAVNNMKYRQGIRPGDLYCEGRGGYRRETYFEAEKTYGYEKETERMKPIKNFENVQEAGGEIQNLPAGGYVCEIKKCSEVANKRSNGTHLEILFDVCEGDWRDFFAGDYKIQNREDKFWHGIINQNIPDEGSPKYEMQARFFKRFVNVIEASNPDYHWDWNEAGLKGKKIGVIFRSVERRSQRGTKYMTTQADSIESIEKIRSERYTVPEPKLLDEQSFNNGSAFASAPADDTADDLPF